MNSLFSIVHYEKLHTQILNVLRKIAKKNTASISFSIYLSLKSPPHSYQDIWSVYVLFF